MLSLLKQSEMLQDITDNFIPLMKQFAIYYFWEQIETKVGKARTYIVDAESAAPAWDAVERCGIAATHSGMVKFNGRGDHGYQVVLGALVRSIKAAPENISLRWKQEQQLRVEERRAEVETILQSQPPNILFPDTPDITPTDSNELYIVPRRSSNYFTGRQMHAKIMKDKFGPTRNQPKRSEHKIFVVYGLGGSGKTQFCLKYLEDNISR